MMTQRRKYSAAALLTFLSLFAVALAQAQAQAPSSHILFTHVNVFDGVAEDLAIDVDVLVEDNLVREVGKGLDVQEGATVIDGGGRTLMPGLTDAHVHLMINDAAARSIYKENWSYVGAQAVAGAKAMLLRGFTTVHDVGGPVTGLKQAIDEGLVVGPRVLPSGALISQTYGHGDLETSKFRRSPYFSGLPDKATLFGWSYVVDGVPEVQKAAREVLRSGAAQIKVMAGGGVSSYFDPLDTTQYTLEELRAVVTEAEHRGTYVTVHAFTDAAVRMAVQAGVKSVEHGPFLQEETLRLMAERGVGWCHRLTCSV